MVQQIAKLYDGKDWTGCISLCNELTTKVGNDMFGYLYRGICHCELNFIEESSEDFTLAYEQLEKNKFCSILNEYADFIKYRIAWNFRKQRKYEQAIQYLNEATENSPKYLPFYKLKASIFSDQDNFSSALEPINQALLINSKDEELIEYRNELVYAISANRTNE